MTTLFGIKNCDTVKKARRWLDNKGHDYQFHDLRVDGLDAPTLKSWLTHLDKDVLINKRSTTWKQLSDSEKSLFEHAPLDSKAIAIVLAQPTLLKRPILSQNADLFVGFNDDMYSSLFS